MRPIWFLIGCITTALGFIGAFVPLMPTVVFLLIAAYAFARSSPRLHEWLMTHPRFGPALQDWQRSGAIAPAAKRLATLSIGATFVISILLGIGIVGLILQAVILSTVLFFIWTRPDA